MAWLQRALLILIAAFVVFFWFLRLGLGPGSQAGVIRIDRVTLAADSGDAPPPPNSPEWRAAQLPWDWRPWGDGRDVWCHANFALGGTTGEPLQLLIAQVAFGADVFLNGEHVATVGRGATGWWGRREVAWLPLPMERVRPGDNSLDLRLRVRPDFAGYLTPIFVGPTRELQGNFRARTAIVGAPDLLVVVCLVLALMFLSLHRHDRRSEWALIALAFTIMALAGLPWRVIDYWVWPLGLAAAVVCVGHAVHRGGGLARPRLERAALVVVALLALSFALAPVRARFPLSHAAGSLAGASSAYLFTLYFNVGVRNWLVHVSALRASVGLGVLIGLNDIPQAWNSSPVIGVPLGPLTHAPMLLASFIHIIGFLSTGLTRARALNQALTESQARLLALEHAQATRAERERVQRDLHDGLGAQLVAALAVAEREPQDNAAVRRSVRLALGELRGAVDSLDGGERALSEVLGALRARLEPLTQGSAARFVWRVGEISAQPQLSAQQALHLLRILQEAIANAVKHSGASTIEVASGAEERAGRRGAFVEVRDDGRGANGAPPGRGLANMRQRAGFIGGEFSVDASAAGTRVRLWLDAAAAPNPSA